jgi:SAM-dependent methyltransferase
MAQNLSESVYPEIAFGGYSRVDGTVVFYSRVQSLLGAASRVLDVGCGRGKDAEDDCRFRRSLCDLRRPGRHVMGIDVDQDGAENPLIDEFRVIHDTNHWPVESESTDLVIANSVLEHVDNPDQFFSEAWRVLKPGGYLCLRTYNKWGYVGICARLIPNRRHGQVTAFVQRDRDEKDVFPTLYRCNTPGAVRRALRRRGFGSWVHTLEAEPSYLRFSPLLYRIGSYAHRIIPAPLRWSILAFAVKPDAQPPKTEAAPGDPRVFSSAIPPSREASVAVAQ